MVSDAEARWKKIEERVLRGDREEIESVRESEDKESKRTGMTKESRETVADQSTLKELQPPIFNDRENENPHKFIEELEEFIEVKGISEKWGKFWFKRGIGENVLAWYEAIGNRAKDFEELKRNFLNRFWSQGRQAEVVRKFYTPGKYQRAAGTKEQHLLRAFNENRYLDHPLSEKNLVMAISWHFGPELAKQVIVANVSEVDEFASILRAWDELEEDREIVKISTRPGQVVNRYNSSESRNWGSRMDEGRRDERNKNHRYYRDADYGRSDWRSRTRNENGAGKSASPDVNRPMKPEDAAKRSLAGSRLNYKGVQL